jgi:hypothetical protein
MSIEKMLGFGVSGCCLVLELLDSWNSQTSSLSAYDIRHCVHHANGIKTFVNP